LRVITGKIRAGEGTLGALVVDPSVYDDLRTVLGNVKRNKVLQELVRITVSNKGGLEQAGKPTDSKPPPPPPPPSTSRTDAARRPQTSPRRRRPRSAGCSGSEPALPSPRCFRC